jgi:anhydro-N-acetylmuramic acid kinase
LPKTIGPELFSLDWVKKAIAQLPKGNPNPYDVMATLTQLTAETIAEAIYEVTSPTQEEVSSQKSLYLSGGGAHNPLIVNILKEKLPGYKIQPMKKLGIDGDAKEAVLFAVLANETVAGRVEEGAFLGGIPMLGMGKISLPG